MTTLVGGDVNCAVCNAIARFVAFPIPSELFVPCRNGCGGTTVVLTAVAGGIAITAVTFETKAEIEAAAAGRPGKGYQA